MQEPEAHSSSGNIRPIGGAEPKLGLRRRGAAKPRNGALKRLDGHADHPTGRGSSLSPHGVGGISKVLLLDLTSLKFSMIVLAPWMRCIQGLRSYIDLS